MEKQAFVTQSSTRVPYLLSKRKIINGDYTHSKRVYSAFKGIVGKSILAILQS